MLDNYSVNNLIKQVVESVVDLSDTIRQCKNFRKQDHIEDNLMKRLLDDFVNNRDYKYEENKASFQGVANM